MRYQRTQIYLDPEKHAKLIAEARERGISLAALLREVVDEHVSEKAPRYDERSWDALIGIVDDDGPPSDIAKHKDEYIAEAMSGVYEKKFSAVRRANSKRKER
jgi:hypothetical protein